MTVFESMVNSNQYRNNFRKDFYISIHEFNNFLKEYTFEKLRGFSMIEYFCSKYNINDFLLTSVKYASDDTAKQLLTIHYVKK